MTRFILLWLEGPLQSWGCSSRFGRRESLNFPTKSGVFGLICSARGVGGEQRGWLSEAVRNEVGRDFDFEVLAYSPKKCGISVLTDFQMIGNGYDSNDPWETLCIPKKSDGKEPRPGDGADVGGIKMTFRQYLEDASFGVVLEVPENLCGEIRKSLEIPVWSTTLGRKSCVPTDFIFQGDFGTKAEALARCKELAENKKKVLRYTVKSCLDGGNGEVDAFSIQDVPVSFGSRKEYAERLVVLVTAPEEPEQ